MKKLKLFNTLSRQKEEFAPIKPGQVGMYLCGPTVYDRATIGNLRTYIFGDILRRTLQYNGYDVKYVQNITDVGHLVGDGDSGEDKLAVSAEKLKETAWKVAEYFTKLYKDDCKKLNIEPPTEWHRATDEIELQKEMVQILISKGFVYETSDGIYFDTSKLSNYGELAHLDIEGLREGARIETNPEKKNPTDFAVWKFSPIDGQKRQMEWTSPAPWEERMGFPGWHLECSAMSTKYLGEPFDIHAGGIDLLPVHHVNEIAQNEAAYGHKTVNYWMHGGFLLINGGRMGKSLGNAYTIDDLIAKGFNPLAYRYLTFTAHYRQELNFTWEALEAANAAYSKLTNTVTSLYPYYEYLSGDYDNEWNDKFLEAVNDDLNMPKALAVVWEMIKTPHEGKKLLETLLKFDEVLGLSLMEKVKQIYEASKFDSDIFPAEIISLFTKRNEAKKNKEWTKSDEIRLKLEEKGYKIKDTPKGPELYNTKMIKYNSL